MEQYTLTKKSNSYKSLARKIISRGKKSKDTRFLKHESISIDMSRVAGDFVILPRFRANNKESSIKYALAETIWYASKRLDTQLISKFGPIWKKMEDSKGLVNSNYGHQIFKNQDVSEKVADLATFKEESKSSRFFIASESNQNSRSDLVCNNALDLYIDKSGKIRVRVIARSIDLVYGYPYDMFAAQLFVRKIQKELKETYDLKTTLQGIRFDIENAHIYDKDIEDRAAVEIFNSKEFITIDSNKIFDEIDKIDFETLDADKIEQIRSKLAESAIILESEHVNSLSEDVDFEIFLDRTPSILRNRLIERKRRDSVAIKQFNKVLEYVNKDLFDRKNLIKFDEDLLYLHRFIGENGVSHYEVTRYAI